MTSIEILIKLKFLSCFSTVSSESALSSEGSEGEGSEGSLGIALRLRPTLPKKQPTMPRFSPAAAWRQLASLDAHLTAGVYSMLMGFTHKSRYCSAGWYECDFSVCIEGSRQYFVGIDFGIGRWNKNIFLDTSIVLLVVRRLRILK